MFVCPFDWMSFTSIDIIILVLTSKLASQDYSIQNNITLGRDKEKQLVIKLTDFCIEHSIDPQENKHNINQNK